MSNKELAEALRLQASATGTPSAMDKAVLVEAAARLEAIGAQGDKIHEVCAAFVDACTRDIKNSLVETAFRPDLANQLRKELIACAWMDLERYHRRLMEKL